MGFIFWMSTGLLSSENTAKVIVPILNFLYPGLTPHQVVMIHGLLRKVGHITEYLILGILLFHAFQGESVQKWRLRWTIYAIIGVFVYAMSDELHQGFIPSRTASPIDVGLDLAGGILSQIAIVFTSKMMR